MFKKTLLRSISKPAEPLFDSAHLSPEEVKKFVPLVGKNSRFSRKIISQYVKLIPKNSYQASKSKWVERVNYERDNKINKEKAENHLKSKAINDENLFKLTQIQTYEILNILNESIDIDKLIDESFEKPKIKQYKYQSYEEIPEIPKIFNEKIMEDYIYQLTNTIYHYKKSSKTNGIISKILRELLKNGNNPNLKYCYNINIFNQVIKFYLQKKDLASMKEYYVQLNNLKIIPNIETINLFLKGIDLTMKFPSNVMNSNGLILKWLKTMVQYDLTPNIDTFLYIYNALPEITSKIILIEFLTKKKIPLSVNLINSILKNLLNSMEPQEVLKNLEKISKDYKLENLNNASLNILIENFLIKEQYSEAWEMFIKYIQIKNTKIFPHVSTLNVFLIHFSKIERFDYCYSVLNFFKKLGIKPDILTHHNLIKCGVKLGYTQYSNQLLRILYHDAYKATKGNIVYNAAYWLNRARGLSLKNPFAEKMLKFAPALTEEEVMFKKMMKEHLNWKNGKFVENPLKIDDGYKEIVLKIMPISKFKKQKPYIRKQLSFDEKVEGLVKKPEKIKSNNGKYNRFLKFSKHNAIVKTYRNRVNYIVNEPSVALDLELKQRGLKS